MKTIGLVTYYNSDNFGAMLQAYALKREIEKNGCRCTLISHNRFSAVHKELAGGSGSKTARRVKTGVRHPRSLKMIASGQTKDIKRGKKRAKIKCASFRDEFFPDKTEIFYYNTDQIMKDPRFSTAMCAAATRFGVPNALREPSRSFWILFPRADLG